MHPRVRFKRAAAKLKRKITGDDHTGNQVREETPTEIQAEEKIVPSGQGQQKQYLEPTPQEQLFENAASGNLSLEDPHGEQQLPPPQDNKYSVPEGCPTWKPLPCPPIIVIPPPAQAPIQERQTDLDLIGVAAVFSIQEDIKALQKTDSEFNHFKKKSPVVTQAPKKTSNNPFSLFCCCKGSDASDEDINEAKQLTTSGPRYSQA